MRGSTIFFGEIRAFLKIAEGIKMLLTPK